MNSGKKVIQGIVGAPTWYDKSGQELSGGGPGEKHSGPSPTANQH